MVVAKIARRSGPAIETGARRRSFRSPDRTQGDGMRVVRRHACVVGIDPLDVRGENAANVRCLLVGPPEQVARSLGPVIRVQGAGYQLGDVGVHHQPVERPGCGN